MTDETDLDPEATAARDAEAKRLGARLKTARRALGLTQREMADRLGVHEKTYPKWESGERVRSWTRLVAASEACRTSPNALLGYEDDAAGGGGEADAAVRAALDPEVFGAALEAISRLAAARTTDGEAFIRDTAFWTTMGEAFIEVIAMTVRGGDAREARAFLDGVSYSLRG